MRLTLLNQFYRPDISPTAHLTASLAEHRAAQGDHVTVITTKGKYLGAGEVPQGERKTSNRRRQRGLDVRRLWSPNFGKRTIIARLLDYLFYYVRATWAMITLPRQDVIISLTTPPYIAWAAILHKLRHRRARVVLWNMDVYPDVVERAGIIRKGGLISHALRAMNRALFRRLDHLICLDTAMADLLISQYAKGRSPLPTTIIPNWEDAAFFPADDKPAEWQDVDGLDDQFVVLYLGNTGVGHAFETLLDAAEKLQEQNIKFLFVGGGSRWESIQSESKRRGLHNIILHPYVAKEWTASVMAVADVALITLRDEALGVMSPSKLHANLAMALPILYVGPAGSNVDDAIRQHNCGASISHGEAARLADTIAQWAANPELLQAMRMRSRQAFDTAYCDLQTLPKFDHLIEKL